MAIFACSFDAASPLAAWTLDNPGGTGIVAGRHGNAVSFHNGTLKTTGSFGASAAVGMAYISTAFNGTPFILSDPTGGPFSFAPLGGFCNFLVLADGRVQLTAGSGTGSSSVMSNGAVIQTGRYRYFEMVAGIIQLIVPSGGSNSNVTITVSMDFYVDNLYVGTVTDTHGPSLQLNTQLPLGVFGKLEIDSATTGSQADDVYIASSRIGDCNVHSDDSTITVDIAAPDITQSVIEVGLQNIISCAPDLTQTVIEVGIQATPWRVYEA